MLLMTLTGSAFSLSHEQSTTAASTTTSSHSPPFVSSHRRVQQSSNNFVNPRFPLHRTPDDIPEPNAISPQELQALWLLQQSPHLDAGTNREQGADDKQGDARRRFLIVVIVVPALAFVLGATLLLRPQKGILWRRFADRRDKKQNTETEGLFQTTDENELAPQSPEQAYYTDKDNKVPEKGFAEIRRNVI